MITQPRDQGKGKSPQRPAHPMVVGSPGPSSALLPVLPERCPRCGDDLGLYHTAKHGRPRHFLGCKSYPHCSYTTDYDGALDQALQALSARLAACEAQLIRVEAHESWLLVQVETLCARLNEQGVPL